MKQGVKTFLHIFGGALFGGSVATIVTYKLTEKKFLKISDDRVKSLNELIEKIEGEKLAMELQYGVVESDDSNSEDGKSGAESSSSISNDERLKPYQEKRPDGTIYTKYSRISNDGNYRSVVDERYEQIAAELEHPMDDDPEDDEDGGMFGRMTQAERDYEAANRGMDAVNQVINSNLIPQVIDEDQIDEAAFDVEELYFYAGDGTLVSEDEEIIPSPMDILGNCLETSGFKNNTNKLLCVENFRRSTVYKISKIFHSYSEKVMH